MASEGTPPAVTMRSVMLAAGGTAGHLFPAHALAQELARRKIAVDLMTDMRGDRYGSDFPARVIYRLPAAPLSGGALLPAMKSDWVLTQGVARHIPVAGSVRPGAVGVWWLSTFAPIVAARLRNPSRPARAGERGARAGHPCLTRGATAIATSFAHQVFGRARVVQGASYGQSRARCREHLGATGLPGARPRGAVLAVDLRRQPGRAGFCRYAAAGAGSVAGTPARQSICRAAMPGGGSAARRGGLQGSQHPGAPGHLFADLPEEMAKAHLVIGRAGASTVAELTVMGRPAILVPLPHALDNDQLQNATRVAEAGGGWCIEQHDLTPERLADTIGRLLPAPDALRAAACRRAAWPAGRPLQFADLVVADSAVLKRVGFSIAGCWGRRFWGTRLMQMPGKPGPSIWSALAASA